MAERSLTLSRPRRVRIGRTPEPSGAGRGLGRSNRRLPLYGVSPADTGAVPKSAGQVGCMATDGSRLPTVSTTMKLGTNATNSNTNKPNKDHPVPRGHTGPPKYHQKASNFDLHTPRTKAAGDDNPHREAAASANVGNGGAILVTAALRPSRPRLRRAASRSGSLDRLAPS